MPSQPSDSEGLHTGSWKDGIGPYHDDDDDESTDEIGGHQNDRQSRGGSSWRIVHHFAPSVV